MDKPAPTRPSGLLAANPPERYRSGMLRRYGLLYHALLLGRVLRGLRLGDHAIDNIRRAAERGPIVYVLYTRSRADWLALNRALNAARLPLARFTNGIRSTWFAPLGDALRELWGAVRRRLRGASPPDALASGWLSEAVARGVPTALFLVPPRRGLSAWLAARTGGLRLEEPRPKGGSSAELVSALLEAQSKSERPIQIVPVVVVWRREPEQVRTPNAIRYVLGSQDEPGFLEKLFYASASHSGVLLQAGAPVDLVEFGDHTAGESPAHRARKLHIVLRRYLYREAHVIRGPRIQPYPVTRRRVLQSPPVRRLIAAEAASTGRSPARVERAVERTLDHLSTRFAWWAVRVADYATRFLWNRIFAGIDVRDEDIERIRAALRDGTPVLVPCHRSHLDYVLLSTVLFDNDVAIPNVIAGDNLSFWPLGWLLRRLGAVFIKRSFKGERIFPTVFRSYIHQILRNGSPVEFFIEGTRSRTGKLLPPRLGVLEMVLDAANDARHGRDITLLPIAISYERIAEERAYARELAGAPKEAEDIGQVVRASKVIGRRYGRVYLRVGEPLPTSQIFAEVGADWDGLDREHRHEVLMHAGERLMYRIASEVLVLPSALVAMAVLADSRRGIRPKLINERVARLLPLLIGQGAQAATSLANLERATNDAVARFRGEKKLNLIEDELGPILQVPNAQRTSLEYYKNGLIHFVAPLSLLASAIASAGTATGSEVTRLFSTQVWLLRYEFTSNPEVPVEELEQRARAALASYGALARDEDGDLIVGDVARLNEIAGITRNFLESYLLVLRAAMVLRSLDLSLDDLIRRVQKVGADLLEVEELRRPEALSSANLRNAVRAWREEGVLQLRIGGGGLQFDEGLLPTYGKLLRALLEARPAREVLR